MPAPHDPALHQPATPAWPPKSAPRLFVAGPLAAGTAVTIDGPQAHYLGRVMRVAPGDAIMLCDDATGEWACRVTEAGKRAVAVVAEVRTRPREDVPDFWLVPALLKKDRFDLVLEKATELGAARIVPLLSERVVTQLDEEDATRKALKLQLVAIEAIKQCGACWLPKIEMPVAPEEFLARREPCELPLIASLQPGSRPAREYFSAFQAQHHRKPQTACVWIGPEGDFTPAEVSAIRSSGAQPITLGRLVLRVETAAIYCLSILHYELEPPPA